MNNWISMLDKEGQFKDLRAPDGTVIEIHKDKCVVVTPDGYRVQIFYPSEYTVLSKIDNSKNKHLADKLFNTTK